MKYCIRATQTGKSNYMMELGHSKKDVEACIIIFLVKSQIAVIDRFSKFDMFLSSLTTCTLGK